MVVLTRQNIILLTLIAAACASELLLDRLSFAGVSKDAVTTWSNSTINTPQLFSLLTTREYRNSLVFGRQEECLPETPVPCPDGIHCTTADHDVCCSDGLQACETGASCCNGGAICTPVGGFCCGESACSSGSVCCPNGCGTPGSTCCGSTLYCSPEQKCCGEGCADEGNTCCGASHQCRPNQQCCPGENEGCAPKESTCCGPEYYCNPGGLCCQDDDDEYFCSPGPQCVDTLTLDLSDYPNQDEIFENMCRGIKQWSLYNPNRPNEILLTYIGKNQNAIARQNRIDAGCAGSPCNRIFGDGVRWSCDEFPPAASEEGGQNAAIICVPQSINSALGSRWRWQVDGQSKGYQARVKIKGVDCSEVPVDKRRSIDIGEAITRGLSKRNAVLKNDTSVVYLDSSIYGNDTGGSVAMVIPFYIPDDFIGTFNVNYAISSGTLKSGSLGDDWGNDFGNIIISESGQTASGSVDVGVDGVGNVMILAWADNTEVVLNYTTNLVTSTATPTPTQKNSAASTPTSTGVLSTGGGLKSSACRFQAHHSLLVVVVLVSWLLLA